MKVIKLFCVLLILTTSVTAEEDILDKILNEVGFNKADLGYQPKGYWNRFPLDIPYRLTSFDDLFAEPLKLYDYSRVMGNTVEFYLDPKYADSASDGLYKLVYNLGVDKKLGGFRSYSANLLPSPQSETPFVDALFKLDSLAEELGFINSTESKQFQKKEINKKIAEYTKNMPDTIQVIVAELIMNLTDAIHWRYLAFRNCDIEDMEVASKINDLAETQGDGQVYYPELDDIAKTIDWQSLHYAALKVVSATENAEKKLKDVLNSIDQKFYFKFPTQFGEIIIISPNIGEKIVGISSAQPLCIIDLGNDNIYKGSYGASNFYRYVSVVIDLDGNDIYENSGSYSSGSGLLGVAVHIDSKGNDIYNATRYSQGFGFFGVGVLLDREGNDKYKSEVSSQGCGYFGIGLCLDGTGDDEFYLYGDGQGMGGIGGGIGVLASFSGNDKYTAEPFAEIADRADYHSEFKINGNSAQGAGFGRRGDITDGHSWAGGLGAIIDIHGDDHYYSGNWSLGVGYWFATGIVYDKNGNDIYESCYFTQGSGAHFCNGILLDENGDDKHELFETAGAALGFGWDFTNAFLINKNGNDSYRAKMISIGLAQIRSFAFLIDIGGDDTYMLGEGTAGLGEASYKEYYKKPSKLTPYYYYGKSFGGFIDIGGDDRYYRFDPKSIVHTKDLQESHLSPDQKINKLSLWLKPTKSDSAYGANNFGVGIDIDSGTVPEFFMWDE